MNMKKLIVTLVVALITFFGYNSLNAQNMKKEEVPQNISAFSGRKSEIQDSNNISRVDLGWHR